jgi:hypothetical protein
MTARYTVYRLKKSARSNKAGAIVEEKSITSAADMEAFEAARAAVLRDRQLMFAEACRTASVLVEEEAA